MRAHVGPVVVSAFRFRGGRPGGTWGVHVYDHAVPRRSNEQNYGLGWSAFQPHLVVNLGRVGVSLGWAFAARAGRWHRALHASAYTFPPPR